MNSLLILLSLILPASPTDNTTYIFIETSTIHVESEAFFEIHKKYIEHQYLTKVDPNILEMWVECERGHIKGELYIDEPGCFASALYALEGRPIIIKGGGSIFFDKMKVKIEPFY